MGVQLWSRLERHDGRVLLCSKWRSHLVRSDAPVAWLVSSFDQQQLLLWSRGKQQALPLPGSSSLALSGAAGTLTLSRAFARKDRADCQWFWTDRPTDRTGASIVSSSAWSLWCVYQTLVPTRVLESQSSPEQRLLPDNEERCGLSSVVAVLGKEIKGYVQYRGKLELLSLSLIQCALSLVDAPALQQPSKVMGLCGSAESSQDNCQNEVTIADDRKRAIAVVLAWIYDANAD